MIKICIYRKCVSIIILICSFPIFGQTIQNDRIILFTEGSASFPADNMIYTIWLTSRDSSDVVRLHNNHKIMENKLIQVLNQYKIPSEAIKYHPMTIGKNNSYFDDPHKAQYLESRQWVEVNFGKIQDYPDFESSLAKAGLLDFTARFGSSKEVEAESLATQIAIQKAKKQAEDISLLINRKIDRISNVYNADDDEPTFSYTMSRFNRVEVAETPLGINSLGNILQSVTTTVHIKVIFELKK